MISSPITVNVTDFKKDDLVFDFCQKKYIPKRQYKLDWKGIRMHASQTSWLLHLPLLPAFMRTPEYLHVNGALIVFLGVVLFSAVAYFLLSRQQEKYIVPSPRLTLVSVLDLLIEALYNMVAGVLGEHTPRHFPFIASLFLFVFLCNLLGLLPFSAAPTANLNTAFALGIATFTYYNVMGVKAQGLRAYIHHFFMGLGAFGLPIALLEIVSQMVRPCSLGLRLFVNMHVDHTVVLSFQNLFEWFLPVPLLLFGIVVSTVQAFVFSILTSVYVQMAIETDHEHA